MKRRTDLLSRLGLSLLALTIPLSLNAEFPDGWFMAGSAPDDYETDVSESARGSASGSLKSKVDDPDGFGTSMKMFSAESFRGGRIELSASIKAVDVSDWAGIWVRIDGPNGERLGFDNMQNRPISGSTDWHDYNVVVNVPQGSEAIALGVLLVGVWHGASG